MRPTTPMMRMGPLRSARSDEGGTEFFLVKILLEEVGWDAQALNGAGISTYST